MTRRLHQIVALLSSILDLEFQPETWSGQLVRRNAVRGESPSRRIACPACDGTGERRLRGVDQPCSRCGGVIGYKNGAPLIINGRGWIEVDDYTERQVGSVRTELLVHTRTVHCDVCAGDGTTLAAHWRGPNNRCLACNGGGRIELTLEQWRSVRTTTNGTGDAQLGQGDPLLACIERKQRVGSYDELLRAMAELKQAWPALYRLVRERYVFGQPLRDERLERLAREAGLSFLEARMPAEIRAPGRRRQEVAA